MGRTLTSTDIVVNSNSCFLCSDPHLSPEPSEHSIQSLSLYLELGLGKEKLFCEKGSTIPLDGLGKVNRSRLKVVLCGQCTLLNERFERLYRQLEKVQMEVVSCLELIREKMLLGVDADVDQIKNGENLNIFNALRTETLRKCYPKVKGVGPRVKIQKLTRQTVAWYKRSRRDPPPPPSQETIQNENLIDPLLEFDNNDNGSPLDDNSMDGDRYSDSDCYDIDATTDEKIFMTEEADLQILLNVNKSSLEVIPDADKGKDNPITHSKKGKGIHQQTGGVSSPTTRPVKLFEGEKYSCRKCGKRLSSQVILFTHETRNSCIRRRQHSRKHQFHCKTCGNGFTTKGTLNRHVKSVHLKVQEHACAFCNKKFDRAGNLDKHVRRIHP